MGIIASHKSGFDAFVTPDGQKRLLSLTAPKPKAMPRLGDHVELIPRSEWKPTNRYDTLNHRFPRYDQGSVGCCEPTSEIEAMGGLRAIAGLPVVPLSFSMLYAQINQGQDNGASIGDAYGCLQQFGVCEQHYMPSGFYTRDQIPDEAWINAKKYRALKAYHCPSFEELVTAHLLEYWVVHGVYVGPRFDDLDSQGVTPAVRGSPNHAISLWDLVSLPGGNWGLRDNNHWGLNWGIDGTFITSEKGYDLQLYQDAIAYEVIATDEDIDLPPRVAA